MSQKFIDQVRAIVMNNISDEKFGVRKLASTLGLSSSQTLRKVKAATGKSVNRYIRELRLEKAAKLIKKTDLTIAEISYKVGFGSPSYFNKTFVKYYGIAPGEYKTKSISLSELAAKNTKKRSRTIFSNKKLMYVSSIVLVLVIGYVLINNSTSKNTSFPNSIAVLPFKDMSPDDTQWFCDGVSDNILHSLSQIKDLTVISFTSSSTFRDSDKKISEIAKELGVSYILEGSVVLYEDNIKIITQLINANDEHVWSKEYNESFDNVIAIQKNVAQEVMKQLEITLSPAEEKTLEKYPTQNMEAYHLFLRGRLVNDSRKEEDLWKNIELNTQAIALDSTFAEAYTEIAFSYFLLSHYHAFTIDAFDAREKAAYYANRALQIDPNTIQALEVNAYLIEYVDWNKAKEYYDKAFSLHPNDDRSHTNYSEYFITRPNPDIKKYLEHATIAQRLNPLSQVAVINLIDALVINNKFKEAEEYIKKMGFLFSERNILWYQSTIIAYKNKDCTKVIPFFKAKIEKDPNNSILYSMLADAYNGILNDDMTAIKYHKKAYEKDSTSSRIAVEYITLLVEGEKFKEAQKLLRSENFKSVVSERQQLRSLWYYNYHQENYEKTLEISKDSLLTSEYYVQSLTYAQLGDRKKVDSINNRYPWGTGRMRDWRGRRAFLHAILKDRDSMYFYLENIKFVSWIRTINGSNEFDPYRNEERFKDILKKHYIPVLSE
ncbi:MAG: helix-turn-helix domain-containing protein [Ignavibacteria bacterium]|nr:helix-turn-helix domain-containing protein [Ignavibacteria bacterium]